VKKEGLRIADEIIAVAHNTDVMILIVLTGFVICSLQSKFEPIGGKLLLYTESAQADAIRLLSFPLSDQVLKFQCRWFTVSDATS
jgi:ABC-type tungstate transport system substrate-binding protein